MSKRRIATPRFPSFLEFQGAYNPGPGIDRKTPRHANARGLLDVEFEELEKVADAVATALQPLRIEPGKGRPTFALDPDCWRSDRTLFLSFQRSDAHPTPELVEAVRDSLKGFPHWRVRLDGDSAEDVIYVYPSVVRMDDQRAGEPIHQTLRRIVRRRMKRRLSSAAEKFPARKGASGLNGRLGLIRSYATGWDNPRPDRRSISEREFYRVRNIVFDALSRHGAVGPTGKHRSEEDFDAADPGAGFFLNDDQWYDKQRYLQLELRPEALTPSLLRNLTDALKPTNGWGVELGGIRYGAATIFADKIVVAGPIFGRCKSASQFLRICKRYLAK